MSQRRSEQVAAVIVVTHTTKESDELGIIFITTHEHLTLFLGILSRAHIVGAEAVVGEVFVLGVEARITRILI